VKSIRIFLASSNELEGDRQAFGKFLYEKSKYWKDDRDIFLEMNNWEDFIDAMSETRLQDEYNKTIEESDIFVLLCWTKLGMYTNEEFEVARKHFQQAGKPLIYTYIKKEPHTQPHDPSLDTFKQRLKDLGHFPTEYENTEALLLHFSGQLDKLYRLKVSGVSPAETNKQTTKAQLFDLINKGDFFDLFEELNKFFLSNNDSLNALMAEYIDQPNNFNKSQFASRLKIFISRNW
jgi:hypothetical protein